jgi:Obg family GTPase CgtA
MKKRIIDLHAGKGGDGIVSFKRSYKVPKGGPDGGNGGNGGNIYAKFLNKTTDFDKSTGSIVRAQNGQKGETNNKNGRSGEHVIITIPKNYSLWITKNNEKKEIKYNYKKLHLLVKGGKGGWGNTKFVLPNRKTPRFSQNGQKGETTTIEVVPKSTADAIIIGEPNSGKTTLLNIISGSNAKTGAYPGTTQTVNYGTYEEGKTLLVVADIPESKTNQNSEHIKTASIVLCVVKNEQLLSKYTNMCDSGQKTIEIVVGEEKEPPSAICGQISDPVLVEEIKKRLQSHFSTLVTKKTTNIKTLETKKPQLKKSKFIVLKKESKFVLDGSTPNLLAETLDLSNGEARYEFFRRMKLLGANRDLVKSGAKPGDIVLVGGKEVSWEF